MLTKSSDEAELVQKWLKNHRFRTISNTTDTIIWARSRCQVRIQRDEQRSCSIDIRAGENCQWASLKYALSQAEEDTQWLVRAPIEIAVSYFLEGKVSRSRAPGARLYAACGPWAYFFKIVLQMLIGIGAVAALCLALIQSIGGYHGQINWTSTAHISMLIITAALAVAGAVELAYTLYTPGPDEALDPLMLGLSSGILLLITRPDVAVTWQFLGVTLGVVSLGTLFLVRRYLLDPRE